MNQIDQVTEVQECKDKGGESYPDILERIKQILNKEDAQWKSKTTYYPMNDTVDYVRNL